MKAASKRDGGFCPVCGVSQRVWLNDGHDKECTFVKIQHAGDYESKFGVKWGRPFKA